MHTIKLKKENESQPYLSQLEEIFVELARLKNPVDENYKNELLIRSLAESFGFISIIAEANNMDYDSICALIKSEVERRNSSVTKDENKPVSVPTALKAGGNDNNEDENKRLC